MLFSFSLISIAPNLPVNMFNDLHDRLYVEYKRQIYEKEFKLFINHLGYKESGNDWKIVNSIGCMGEYQFAYKTLKHLGYPNITPKRFKQDPNIFPPELQLKVLNELIQANMTYLIPYYDYIGKTINGIEISKAGLIAGSHLGGAGSVKLYLLSNGKINKKDKYGTSISDYLKEFAYYDL